jgi:hypothetical protein
LISEKKPFANIGSIGREPKHLWFRAGGRSVRVA